MTIVIPPQPIELPLTPILVTQGGSNPSASPDPNPLVSVQQYRKVTGDSWSEDEDVEDAVEDAITMVCQECTRTLKYGYYSEVQYLYENGMVFPSTVPIDPTMPISSQQVIYNPLTDDSPGSIIQGWGVWVGWFTPLPWMPVFTGVLDPQTEITYWGGYRQSNLPPKLRRLICRIAFKSIPQNNNLLANVPGGLTSASVAGININGAAMSMLSITDSQIKRDLRRFKRPQVEAWQS
jgi:hypothetical protein